MKKIVHYFKGNSYGFAVLINVPRVNTLDLKANQIFTFILHTNENSGK